MKKIIFLILFILLIYTRFVNIDWGLPYLFHPDERNMAVAIQSMNCKFSIFNPSADGQFSNDGCLNPHFFAYGQFPLYLGYFFVQIFHLINGQFGQAVSLSEAIVSLRAISAVASIINVFVLLKILQLIITNFQFSIFNKIPNFKFKNSNFLTTNYSLLTITLLIFSPALIQFAHFGTTESLLMLFYLLIIYESLRLLSGRLKVVDITLLSVMTGLAIATKISSVVFLAVPLIVILIRVKEEITEKFYFATKFLITSILVGIIFSPYNIISLPDFLGSMNYESSVAVGTYIVFYTRQFLMAIPGLFQFTHIFPYALGWPVFILGALGILMLPWREKEYNLLRFAFFVYFIPNAFLYAKWTRFMAPVFPVMIIFAILFVSKFSIFNFQFSLKYKLLNLLTIITAILAIIPGIAYLSIYQNPDVRFQASEWIYKNIPNDSLILSETANVVDLPIRQYPPPKDAQEKPVPYYRYISFNFYDLDENPILQKDLNTYLNKADYIFVPSRRIFANHNKTKYPRVFDYYEKLFSGELGFTKVAEFTSYPKISLFDKTFIEFPDEKAEETWTVFDHPVIRIFKRTSKLIVNP